MNINRNQAARTDVQNKYAIYRTGTKICINEHIINKFTRIDNIVKKSNVMNCYYFDEMDIFRLKNYKQEIVPDGFYKIKTDFNSVKLKDWDKSSYYMYYVINGIIKSIAKEGLYADFEHSRLTKTLPNGVTTDVSDGYYLYKDIVIKSHDNIIKNIPNGYYEISINNGTPKIYTL